MSICDKVTNTNVYEAQILITIIIIYWKKETVKIITTTEFNSLYRKKCEKEKSLRILLHQFMVLNIVFEHITIL